jgi:hypothetical protein
VRGPIKDVLTDARDALLAAKMGDNDLEIRRREHVMKKLEDQVKNGFTTTNSDILFTLAKKVVSG